MECNITQGLLNNFFFVKKPLMPSFVKCWKKHSLAQKKAHYHSSSEEKKIL